MPKAGNLLPGQSAPLIRVRALRLSGLPDGRDAIREHAHTAAFMFLFCASRNGVAAKEVQRQLGVTYKTAWRMCNLIRKYMGYVDGDFPLGGPGKTVEIDETFIGGKDAAGHDDKAVVLRHRRAQRRRANLRHVQNAHQGACHSACRDPYVKPGTKIYTDEGSAFRLLTEKYGCHHQAVDHSAKEYVRGDVHTKYD